MHGAPGHVGACFREEPVNGTRHDFLGQQSRDGRCRNCNSSSFLVTAPSSCVESTPACPPRLDDSGACPQAPQAEPPLSLLRQVGRDGGRSGVPFTLASQSIKGEPIGHARFQPGAAGAMLSKATGGVEAARLSAVSRDRRACTTRWCAPAWGCAVGGWACACGGAGLSMVPSMPGVRDRRAAHRARVSSQSTN